MRISAIEPVCRTYGKRGIFMVKILTDTGLCGWGEGGISGREQGMAAIVESFKPHLLGEDPRRIDYLWQLMFRGGFFESGTVMSGAISAIDIALWDILGKHYGVPCWQLLGGQSRDRVECYCHCVLSNARQKQSEGWRYFRFGASSIADRNKAMDPDSAVREIIETMFKARELLGPDAKIGIDLHTRFSPPTAAQICEGIAPMRPFFVEDPLRSTSPKTYVAFRQRTSVPLAVGEECSSKYEFQLLIEEDAIDYVRLDISNVGGLTEARKVAAMAETHYMELIPHNPLGPIANAAGVHLGVALPNFMLLENSGGSGLTHPAFINTLQFNTPFFELPTAPGLGIEVDERVLADYPWQPWMPPIFKRIDGSFTNW